MKRGGEGKLTVCGPLKKRARTVENEKKSEEAGEGGRNVAGFG